MGVNGQVKVFMILLTNKFVWGIGVMGNITLQQNIW